VHAPRAAVAVQLVPAGNRVEEWVAGPLTDEGREQLVMVAREMASAVEAGYNGPSSE